ncbi:S41 family peptidase [Tenacibaculum agarivorans]|uniref:S41 family peptidase n=1 Tax=Tenacibaculum agarivorans TaxID=1908389 RepID=UPI0009FA42E8|nr:S41 family peptidase [Tenacibaculum agarivorans]
MKHVKNVFFILLIFLPFSNIAQSKNDIINVIKKRMLENYIFLDKAKETNEYLDRLMTINYFEKFTNPRDFARALSKEMQKITKDKHLNIAPPRQRPQTPNNSDFISRHLANLTRFRSGGFGKIDVLDGNIGYVELNDFRREDISKVDDIMKYLSTADAIIIDLRKNGGGNSLGQYWSSYFLKENTQLSGMYERRTDTKTEIKTTSIKGEQRLSVPLFILTSNQTFSAAEAFSYDLQSRKRATIIGEITGGGAHPVNYMSLSKGYGIIMPYARSISPVTNSNWEGIGVIPDVKTTKEKALNKAIALALISSKKYRQKPFTKLKLILEKDTITQADENKIHDLFTILLKRGHVEYFVINDLGYSYLDKNKIATAHIIFKLNLKFFPKLPNTHDSYAEILALQGNKKEALQHYEKAVFLAEEQNHRQLALFKKNLSKFKANNK